MNEYQVIDFVNDMEPLNKLRYYMEYFCNCLPNKASISFEQFCSPKNIITHDVGEDWKEHGYASQKWINLSAGSIYHSVYHKLISKTLQPKYYVRRISFNRTTYPGFIPNAGPDLMLWATDKDGNDSWGNNFCLITPTDIARNSDGTPRQVKEEFKYKP